MEQWYKSEGLKCGTGQVAYGMADVRMSNR